MSKVKEEYYELLKQIKGYSALKMNDEIVNYVDELEEKETKFAVLIKTIYNMAKDDSSADCIPCLIGSDECHGCIKRIIEKCYKEITGEPIE